jgi:hypothetical protein
MTIGRNAGVSALIAIALTALLSTSGCGERSLPAATRPVDVSRVEASTSLPTPTAAPVSAAPVTNNPAPSPSAASPAPLSKNDAARAAFFARHQQLRDITFDTVKLNLKKGDPYHSDLLTPAIKQLDGTHVRIRGFILPPPEQSGLTRFVLVRDNMACCFGPGAAIYDSMIVDMKKPLTTDYTPIPITVEGTFSIHEVRAGSRTLAIYHVTADKAQ